MMFDGGAESGFTSHTDRYVTRDGDKVFVRMIYFDSAKNASRRERTMLHGNKFSVLLRRQRRDQHGQKLGETIVALKRDRSTNAATTFVMGTSRNTVFEIWSASSNITNVEALAKRVGVL